MKEIAESVLTIKDYGRINICLKKLMDQKKIKRNTLASLVGTRFEVIKKWYDGDVEKLDLDILARVCYVLGCEPADIITYVKASGVKEENDNLKQAPASNG